MHYKQKSTYNMNSDLSFEVITDAYNHGYYVYKDILDHVFFILGLEVISPVICKQKYQNVRNKNSATGRANNTV